MAGQHQFRALLPVAQCGLAALFGGWGLWERSTILSRPMFAGQTWWDSTARFHVWPWPYKFAAIENLPALLGGLILTWPIKAIKPDLPEAVQAVPSLLLVVVLWYWVGSRLDRRCLVGEGTPWIFLIVFTALCLTGAFLPIGYTGYLPYAALVWLVAILTFLGMNKHSRHS